MKGFFKPKGGEKWHYIFGFCHNYGRGDLIFRWEWKLGEDIKKEEVCEKCLVNFVRDRLERK